MGKSRDFFKKIRDTEGTFHAKVGSIKDRNDSVGEGEGGMIWENGIETCIISYKKRIASPGSIQDPWGWCTGMTWRDSYGEGGGRGCSGWGTRVRPWRIHVDVWQNQYNIVK